VNFAVRGELNAVRRRTLETAMLATLVATRIGIARSRKPDLLG
jgi:hypothetical protein